MNRLESKIRVLEETIKELTEQRQELIDRAVAREREACAMVCELRLWRDMDGVPVEDGPSDLINPELIAVAEAIRARGGVAA